MSDYQILPGDCLETMRQLPSASVQTCVTSPPYYGLRDYGTAEWEGGDVDCDHVEKFNRNDGDRQDANGFAGNANKEGHAHMGAKQYRDICGKCGARRIDNQIGLEESPEVYVAKLVEVFREVRRVLKDDGVLWLNLGDSFWGGKGKSGYELPYEAKARRHLGRTIQNAHNVPGGRVMRPTDGKHDVIKPKDLIGIPWMVAFALRADGWYLRSDIIWCLSGGTWVYARTQKGDMPMMIRDLARLNPATVQLWNGEKWTQLLGMSKSVRRGDELELVLRSGERISCTPTHKFPTSRGLLQASDIQVGDVIEHCRLPEPESPLIPEHVTEEAAWFAGLYIAEGHRDDKIIYIAGHVKEIERLERVRRIAAAYGGSANVSISGNKMTIRVHGRMLHAILDMLVTGVGAKKKGFSPLVWRYSNNFLSSMLDGYLSGDGHWDAPNNRWRLGLTRNYNLERDFRTVCARLGLRLTLNMTNTAYDGGTVPTFRGEIRMERSGHRNEKDMGEVVEIRNARCREVYDLGVADEPHVFALASGILTHNSKPNPMPESVTDRPTKAHEYIFLLSKSSSYFYDADAIQEDATTNLVNKILPRGSQGYAAASAGVNGSAQRGHVNGYGYSGEGRRNRRSVWTVTTKPYSGAHFATFPPDLIEPCILAGSKPGDTVLDPFNGAATTGLVALKHGRKYIGCELNPDYIELSHKRLLGVASQQRLFEVTA